MTLFSLVMGTKGRTDELERFLASLDAQTYRDFELILVEQNHDERLAPILAPYQERFPILHLHSQPGLTRARNVGLEYISGGFVGFPDDDCQYPSGLLGEVARFFAEHPQMDGLTGRAVDESGEDINSNFDRKAGEITRYNIWYRGVSFNIFLRASTARSARFDEEIGPGAGTIWGAGDETDYLLKLLGKGASLFYDPSIVVVHRREPTTRRDAAVLRRAYMYACGGSYVAKKHGHPLWFKAWWVLRSVVALALPLIGLRKDPGFKQRWSTLRGKLRGLR